MTQSMQLSSNLMGEKFTVANLPGPTETFTCVGFAQNETFIIFGACNDTPNNRYAIRSFKLTDARFMGQVKSN